MIDHTLVLLALRNRLLTLPDLPGESSYPSWTAAMLPYMPGFAQLPALVRSYANFAFENVRFVPTTGVEYIEEQYVPGPSSLLGLRAGGVVETTGLYIVNWYSVANQGVTQPSVNADAVLALFPPGAAVATMTDGNVVRVRGDVAPSRGQLRQAKQAGFAIIPITIPWRVQTYNAA